MSREFQDSEGYRVSREDLSRSYSSDWLTGNKQPAQNPISDVMKNNAHQPDAPDAEATDPAKSLEQMSRRHIDEAKAIKPEPTFDPTKPDQRDLETHKRKILQNDETIRKASVEIDGINEAANKLKNAEFGTQTETPSLTRTFMSEATVGAAVGTAATMAANAILPGSGTIVAGVSALTSAGRLTKAFGGAVNGAEHAQSSQQLFDKLSNIPGLKTPSFDMSDAELTRASLEGITALKLQDPGIYAHTLNAMSDNNAQILAAINNTEDYRKRLEREAALAAQSGGATSQKFAQQASYVLGTSITS